MCFDPISAGIAAAKAIGALLGKGAATASAGGAASAAGGAAAGTAATAVGVGSKLATAGKLALNIGKQALISSAPTLAQQALQVSASNAAARQMYGMQLRQGRLVAREAQTAYNLNTARQRVEAMRQSEGALAGARQQILENLRRQAQAQASQASSGITGVMRDTLFNEYEQAIGNINNNLQTEYQQIVQNQFFGEESARLQSQSIINQAFPAAPFQASVNPWPTLAIGALPGGLGALQGLKAFGKSPGVRKPPAAAKPLGPIFGPNPKK